MRLFRCQCNAVSSPEIATNPGDYKSMKFHQDPNDPNQMICDDCFQAEEEVNSEWMDDVMEEEFDLEDTDDYDDDFFDDLSDDSV